MPWSLDLMSLLVVLVVLFVAGAGWEAGRFIMNKLLTALFSRRTPSGSP